MQSPNRCPNIDDLVRLTRDIPELQLRQGDLGVVCSTWCSPAAAYEVDFGPMPGLDVHTRALLLAEQLQVDDAAKNPIMHA